MVQGDVLVYCRAPVRQLEDAGKGSKPTDGLKRLGAAPVTIQFRIMEYEGLNDKSNSGANQHLANKIKKVAEHNNKFLHDLVVYISAQTKEPSTGNCEKQFVNQTSFSHTFHKILFDHIYFAF